MSNISRMDLNLLKALDALLTERSVTRAATRLSLTQPAVSGMLTRLRESFGDPLFARSRHGIVPTARALDLAEPVRRILDEAEALLQPQSFIPAEATFTLSISATDYAQRAVVVPFLTALHAQAPGIRISVCCIDLSKLHDQLERGDVDFALMTPETVPADLHTRRLFDERYVCVMRADHPAGNLPMTLDRFCALDHALVSLSGGCFWGVTDDVLAKLGRRRNVVLSIGSFLNLVEVLRCSDLVAVVPRRLVCRTAGLKVFDPPIEIPGFTKVVAWHERSHRDPGMQWVRSLLFSTSEVPV